MSYPDPANGVHSNGIVLLTILTTIKEDIECLEAKVIFDTIMRLPDEFICPSKNADRTLTSSLNHYTLLKHVPRLKQICSLDLNRHRDTIAVKRLRVAHLESCCICSYLPSLTCGMALQLMSAKVFSYITVVAGEPPSQLSKTTQHH